MKNTAEPLSKEVKRLWLKFQKSSHCEKAKQLSKLHSRIRQAGYDLDSNKLTDTRAISIMYDSGAIELTWKE